MRKKSSDILEITSKLLAVFASCTNGGLKIF